MQTFSLEHRWSKPIPVAVSVGATVEVFETYMTVDFAVREPLSCFCLKKEHDGEAVWEDSCVEVFMGMFDRSGRYMNLEFNSKGVCYASRGKGRENREEFSKEEYALIVRNLGKVSTEGNFKRWMLSVQIPRKLLGVDSGDMRNFQIEGNLCKCADAAAEPHYMSAFPINTKTPDFHRPQDFQDLNRPSWNA